MFAHAHKHQQDHTKELARVMTEAAPEFAAGSAVCEVALGECCRVLQCVAVCCSEWLQCVVMQWAGFAAESAVCEVALGMCL